MNHRRISFEKIFNVRELGTLPTAQGRTVSSGLLLRSANLADATQTDKRVLQERFRLAKIIDLRTETERKERPDAVIPGAEYRPIPIFDESIAGISHERSLDKEAILASIPKMGTLYRQMVTEPSCRQSLGKAARCVMEHDFSTGSVLWHCTEGKDRCGLLSAVLLLALGVERRIVLEDYLLTNEVNEAKAEKFYHMMRMAGKDETQAAIIRDLFLAKEEYLIEAFAAIDEQYENTDAFLRDGLKIPQESVERFRKSVLV